MSTIKSVYLQHLNGTTPNATMDTNGNFTVGGTVSGASSNMFRNRIINGAMTIDQRNAGASVTPSVGVTYILDRWHLNVSQSSKLSAQQNAGSVTPPTGFVNYFGITSQSAYSVLSTDYATVRQSIEGYNTSDLNWGTANAKTITLSFWVRSSLTGTFGGSLNNDDYSRSYPFTYTINASNTWQYKNITIPGDTSGTWQTTNSSGINVGFGLGTGSSYLGASGSWSSNIWLGATGQTNLLGTSGATFYITGVQLEVGTTATPFEVRSYGHELALCQRYYWKSYNQSDVPGASTATGTMTTGAVNGGTTIRWSMNFPVSMRTTPTVTLYTASGTSGYWTGSTSATAIAHGQNSSGWEMYASGSDNRPYGHLVATAEL